MAAGIGQAGPLKVEPSADAGVPELDLPFSGESIREVDVLADGEPAGGERVPARVGEAGAAEIKLATDAGAGHADLAFRSGQPLAEHVLADTEPERGEHAAARVGEAGFDEVELAADLCGAQAHLAGCGESATAEHAQPDREAIGIKSGAPSAVQPRAVQADPTADVCAAQPHPAVCGEPVGGHALLYGEAVTVERRPAGAGDISGTEVEPAADVRSRQAYSRAGRESVIELQIAFGMQLACGDARYMAAGQANGYGLGLHQVDRLIDRAAVQ